MKEQITGGCWETSKWVAGFLCFRGFRPAFLTSEHPDPVDFGPLWSCLLFLPGLLPFPWAPCGLGISCWVRPLAPVPAVRFLSGSLEVPVLPFLGLSRPDGLCCPVASTSHLSLDPEGSSWAAGSLEGPRRPILPGHNRHGEDQARLV